MWTKVKVSDRVSPEQLTDGRKTALETSSNTAGSSWQGLPAPTLDRAFVGSVSAAAAAAPAKSTMSGSDQRLAVKWCDD